MLRNNSKVKSSTPARTPRTNPANTPAPGTNANQALILFAVLTDYGMDGTDPVNWTKIAARIGQGYNGKKARCAFREWLQRNRFWADDDLPKLREIDGFDDDKYGDSYKFTGETFEEDEGEADGLDDDSEDDADEEEEEEEDLTKKTKKSKKVARKKKKLQGRDKKRKANARVVEDNEDEDEDNKRSRPAKKRK